MQKPNADFWNDRYSEAFASYGTEPNAFLKSVAHRVPKGDVLVIACGEGRDAVYLAEQGYTVTAVDLSDRGIANTKALAAERGVSVAAYVADLADFDFGEGRWAGIVSIWAHLPPELRRSVHGRSVRSLQKGGAFVLEAYAPAHLKSPGVGGPPNVEMLMAVDDLREELGGLGFEICHEIEREVQEGTKHTGLSVTTQVLGFKA